MKNNWDVILIIKGRGEDGFIREAKVRVEVEICVHITNKVEVIKVVDVEKRRRNIEGSQCWIWSAWGLGLVSFVIACSKKLKHWYCCLLTWEKHSNLIYNQYIQIKSI